MVAVTAPGVAAAEPQNLMTGVQRFCEFIVRYDRTGVHANPDTNSTILKFKNAGERVTGNCDWHYDTEGQTYFDAVDCSGVRDGEGWIKSWRLRPDL